MSPQPVTAALELAEDAITAALNALEPTGEAHWDGMPVGDVKRLQAYGFNPAAPGGLARCYVAQHQDGGGARVQQLNAESWSGLVLIRVQSCVDAQARAGLQLAVVAMQGLTSPAGYTLFARYERPRAIPYSPADKIFTRAAQWRVTIRRV
ncbi:MAG TPA: hypothetical protein VEA41_07970 [Salinarimonas sp.]|nr:hypothetical protein [Salinarimonas sp.]